MKQANIIFLEMLASTMSTLPRVKVLDKDTKGKYIDNRRLSVQIDSELCNAWATELKKIILEERMANGTEEEF